VTGDFNLRLADLAAEILHDAIQVYRQADMERWLISSSPGLPSWQVGMFAAAEARGAFPAGGDSAIHGLRTTFGIPRRLPALRPPESRELAAQARSAPLLAKLGALAAWTGPAGRLVTATDELAPADAADAARRTGISPGELPYLWEYALASWWLELRDDDAGRTHAVPGEIAARWAAGPAAGDDSAAPYVWAVVFAAVLAQALNVAAALDPAAAERLSFDGQGVAIAVRLFLARPRGLTGAEVRRLIMDGAAGGSSPRARRARDAWEHAHGDPARPLLTSLTDLGAVFASGGRPPQTPPFRGTARPPETPWGEQAPQTPAPAAPYDPAAAQAPADTIELTALALWAMREQLTMAGVDVPLLPARLADMTAADLVALAGGVSAERFRADAVAWAGREPERAARELLDLAAASGPRTRLVAVRAVRHLGAAAAPAWRSAIRRPELRAYARIALAVAASGMPEATMPFVVAPEPDDLTWMATDLLALACGDEDPDPEAIRAQFAEAVPAGEEPWILDLMSRGSHPDVVRVLTVLARHHPDRKVARDARKAAAAARRARDAIAR
jgi:hypothetical protein